MHLRRQSQKVMAQLIGVVMHPVSQIALMFGNVVLITGLIVTAPTEPLFVPAPSWCADILTPHDGGR